MTLQLPSFLDVSSNKHVAFEIMALLMGKKPPQSSKKLKKKPCIQLVKKPPKFDEKIRRKTKNSIDKKFPKLDEKTKKKTDHLLLYRR